jgi:EasF-like predicted methyltransferase
MNRSISPPVRGYQIIDIRNPLAYSSKLKTQEYQDVRPPSPPESDNTSEDVFNEDELVDSLLDGLDKPLNHKSLPTFMLYDKKGLQLFDEITTLDDEYYLTNAELDILKNNAEEMTHYLQDGGVIFELGAGSLRKTLVILRAIEKSKKNITYYALDLDQHELDRSLSSLGEFQHVQLFGLLGTYDQGIPWINSNFSSCNVQKTFLWLGSSIGNQNRFEASLFLRKLQEQCMEPGDLIFIGFDKRNEPAKIELAYDDTRGVTREFIMNGLDHVNQVMGEDNFIDRRLFEYHSIYQEKQGRHLSHYQALQDMTLTYKSSNIKIQKDELIHVESSYKYSFEEIECILSVAELNLFTYWVDSKDQYRLVVGEKRPFNFERSLHKVHENLFPSKETIEQEPISCYHCTEGMLVTLEDYLHGGNEKLDIAMFHNKRSWPIQLVPSKHDWKELWKSWDLVCQMIDHKSMLFEKPISLRHPFIFYFGHIPAFLDIQLSRHQVDKEFGPTDLTEPHYFADIFERGIDPDMEDPTQCHPHSEVPTSEEEWPSYESILAYQKSVGDRLDRLLTYWEADAFKLQSEDWIKLNPDRRRQARITWMCFEHTAMHLETLLYMLVQSPNALPPKYIMAPSWKHQIQTGTHKSLEPLDEAPLMTIASSLVTLGHNDFESQDFSMSEGLHEFGWDNETPEVKFKVNEYRIQTRPVTNGEYYMFLKETKTDTIPASWLYKDNEFYVKTVFGPCPLVYAQHWPVQTSYNEAEKYAKFKGGRLPSEAELVLFRDKSIEQHKKEVKWSNIGFDNWTPCNVDNEQIHNLGDVWEWTETIFDECKGFQASEIYPGYSADFFDGKHRVVLGGSWATHPRIAERRSFRNWYQSGYQYVFSGFRLCK